jgi:hypothetical protein
MAGDLSKLCPSKDLQCYFFEPSAVAALSATSESGFTVSGCWRQQFDWAVVEWNRDNVFEHPALRNLPDGNLSGVHLVYAETRTNCIPIDSTWYPTVDWPYLRIWADSNGIDTVYRVPLLNYATPITGSYASATVQFELQGLPTVGDYIELAWLDQHFNHQITDGDTLESALSTLATAINGSPGAGATAAAVANQIILTYTGAAGSNGNRIGVYGTVHGSGTESWTPSSSLFSGGVSPSQWQIDLDFGNLHDATGAIVPTSNVRKMRWTWAADIQPAAFARSEFSVLMSDWTARGTNLQYQVAGPGSRRIEDDASEMAYQGSWTEDRGNYSGGSIRWSTTPGARASCSYLAQTTHILYLGTRRTATGGQISAQVDGGTPVAVNLQLSGEDALVRVALGQFQGPASHTVTLTHAGPAGSFVYFDFLELAVPCTSLPTFEKSPVLTLATDWDTNHSLALAPERTAWLIHTLGFGGRANHYAGALWFYELCQPGQAYAAASVQFSGAPEWSKYTQIALGQTVIQHQILIGDTAESIATCFEFLINAGSTGVWAQAHGASLTITARAMGSQGNSITVAANTNSAQFTAQTSGPSLSGGTDGRAEGPQQTVWRTDLQAVPRLNRAARDWHRSFLAALKAFGINAAVAFSMELQNGDDTPDTGLAQRYPDGSPAWLNTPALQTNFSPVSTGFWQQVYLEMASVMADADVDPYLQFGEVQWWYFAAPSGMPFFDEYTKSAFQIAYGRPMRVIPSQNSAPEDYAQECAFLPALVGKFTDTVMSFVRQSQPSARFEVLYPPDVNNTPLNQLINLPISYWTPAKLGCLKTENFTYTGNRNLDQARQSIELPLSLGFARSQASHLVGIGDYTTPWDKEQNLSLGEGLESVVLFALDQFCLIGYGLPLGGSVGRASFMGG